jgi:membrane protease YdiL (CAAX protease family)
MALTEPAPLEAVGDIFDFATRPLALAPALLFISPGLLVAAAAEEVLFRGWALTAISVRLGAGPAVAISSLLFAAAHVYPSQWADPAMLLSLLGYVAAGAALCVIALKQRHLYGAIAAHTGYNVALLLQSYAEGGFKAESVARELLVAERGVDAALPAAIWLLLQLALLLFLIRQRFGSEAVRPAA